MVNIGHNVGRTTYAVISDMNQPLGIAIGNNLEVIEAIDTLSGNGPEDLLDASLTLASYMLLGAKRVTTIEEARELLLNTIKDGSALKKFAEFVTAQGGDAGPVFDTSLFPKASIIEPVYAPNGGYVSEIHTDEIGMTSLILGGGRETKESEIDLTVGMKIHAKIGDEVTTETPIATLYANDPEKLSAAKERFLKAYTISNEKVKAPNHIHGIVTKDGATKF